MFTYSKTVSINTYEYELFMNFKKFSPCNSSYQLFFVLQVRISNFEKIEIEQSRTCGCQMCRRRQRRRRRGH